MMKNLGLMQRLMRRLTSTYLVLVLLSVSANFVAYALSKRAPPGFVEMNPFAHPESFSSIGFSEGCVLTGSLLVLLSFDNVEQRNIIQSFFAGFQFGDAANDIVLMITSAAYVAIVVSYATAALIPTVVAMKSVRLRGSEN